MADKKLGVWWSATAAALVAVCGMATPVMAQDGPPPASRESNLPPWASISSGFEKVVSTADGQSLYTLYKRERDGAMMAEMPKGYEGQRHFFAMTVATGPKAPWNNMP